MTARFTTLQKVILLLLAAMTVIFALLTAVSRSRPGVSFEGALLRSTQEGEAAVYTGRVHGDPTTITVRPEGGPFRCFSVPSILFSSCPCAFSTVQV